MTTSPPLPGSNADLQEVVDRILRLTLNDQVAGALLPADVEALQFRAQEALQTLALCDAGLGAEAAKRQVEAATPALCSMAVACVTIVEHSELSTGLARLVAAGCEVLAGLLLPRVSAEATSYYQEDPSYSFWVDDTLEELSDQLDFLALEVYCGLGRLEGAVSESDELPVVPDQMFDRFESYWGSIEHRQALQEVSAWLLCVVFRAIGYSAVTARKLMEFANHDLLCLCALLRGLFAVRPGGNGLPHDAAGIQGIALGAVCGLTAPELAFPYYNQISSVETIEEQNKVLALYREVLCAAFVETGLFEAALDIALVHGQSNDGGQPLGVRFLVFLAAVVKQAGDVQPTSEDPSPPAMRLRCAVAKRADRLGHLLHAVCEQPLAGATLRQLVGSCAELTALVSTSSATLDDAFTLECRMLLSAWLDRVCFEECEKAATLVALSALAANVGDFEISRPRLAELISSLQPEDRARARARFTRVDAPTMLRSAAEAMELFADPHVPLASSEEVWPPERQVPPPVATPPIAAIPSAPGLRDLLQYVPEEFRCALDRKLLCDPVVSPGGIVFERSTLVRWMQKHEAVCPITGMPLHVEDCVRSPAIRKQVTEWVRTAGREHRPRKKAQHRE